MDRKLLTSPLPNDSVYNVMWVRHSELECEIYAISSRMVRTKAEIDSMSENIKRRRSVLRNLRSRKTVIVSMTEYAKVQDELGKLLKVRQDKIEYLTYDRTRTEHLRQDLKEISAQMETRLHPNNLLQFRKIS